MKGHVAVWRTDSPTYALFRGPLQRWFVDHGIAALRTPRLRGWQVRSERVADVVAQLEAEDYAVRVYDKQARP